MMMNWRNANMNKILKVELGGGGEGYRWNQSLQKD